MEIINKKNVWLIIAHSVDKEEYDLFKQQFIKAKKNLDDNTEMYIIHIYSKKICRIYHLTKHDDNFTKDKFKCDKYTYQGTMRQKKWLGDMRKYVVKLAQETNSDIIGILYYGHGGGGVLGSYSDVLMGFSTFVEIFVVDIKPRILFLDSCYLGSITSLYELAPYVKYVVGSPAWHAYKSLTSIKLFGKLPSKNNDNDVFKKYIRNIVCIYNDFKDLPQYACSLAFDLTNMDTIVSKIKKLYLTTENKIKIHKKDTTYNEKDTYELEKAVEKNIKKDIQSIVISTNNCKKNCPKTIQGISIYDVKKGDVWQSYFKKTRWGKMIKNIEIIR